VIDSWSRKGGGKGRAIDAGVFFFFGSLTKIERKCKRKRAINIIVYHLHLEKEESSCRKNFRKRKRSKLQMPTTMINKSLPDTDLLDLNSGASELSRRREDDRQHMRPS
jgi:hypothetical protein